MSERIAERESSSVGRFFGVLNKGLTYLSMVALVIIMLLTSADATGRYLLNSPITGAVEFVGEYLLVAAVFLAMAYTYREGVFVRVTLFVGRMTRGVRFVLDHIIQAASAVVCIVLVYSAIEQTQLVYMMHTTTNSNIGYELWPAYAIVAISVAVLAIVVTADVLQVRRGQSGLFKRENEFASED